MPAFETTGKHISDDLARKICQVTDMYSSYVQPLVEMNDPILALWLMRRVWKE